MGIAKVIVGFIWNSHALIIDGLHSFSDLATDVFVILITRFSNEAPDEEHPYGHGKFETIGTLTLGSLLFATAGALGFESMQRIFSGEVVAVPGWPTILVAAASIIIKEVFYQLTKRVGVKHNSKLIIANAWHSRSDAISSLFVLIGIVLTIFGLNYMDGIASMIVVFMIGKIGWDFVRASLSELADTNLDKGKQKEFFKTILEIDGVVDAHNLRTRKMGPQIVIDVNIQVPEDISVSEGHEISSWVAKVLIEKYEDVTDVVVHTDVENDMVSAFTSNKIDLLPLRNIVLDELNSAWKGDFDLSSAEFIRLNYLKNKIEVELFLSEKKPEDFFGRLKEKAQKISWFKDITIFYTN